MEAQITPGPKLTRKEKIAAGIPKPHLGAQRKKVVADARKEALRDEYFAKLNDYPTSPRKMRLLADMVRGKDVAHARALLKLHPRHASRPLLKLLGAAIDSFENKSGLRPDNVELYIQIITVDSGPMLKRLRPAPQGRGHRIRKRSNHVTIKLAVRDNGTSAKVTPARDTETVRQPRNSKTLAAQSI